MKMLIVAEERGLIEALTIGLAYEWPDMRILTATDGAAGLRQFVQEAPDLTLLDLHLRDNAGWTLLRQMREVSRAPVIVLAARGAELEEVKRQGLEPDEYLVTPFSHGQLFTRIIAALHGVAEAQPVPPTETAAGGPASASAGVLRLRSGAAGHAGPRANRQTPAVTARRRAEHVPHLAPRHG
jgi:two-component system, OmpR family, KDP operon response regulator KdpE